jgi:hypothetical protein
MTRCGSYPFVYLSKDWQLPYASVLLFSDGMRALRSNGAIAINFHHLHAWADCAARLGAERFAPFCAEIERLTFPEAQ